MAAGITQSYSHKAINDFEIIRFEKLTVILRAIKYPITVPTIFVIISFISLVLKVKICDISIILVVMNPINVIFLTFLNLSHNIGNRKPKGTNKSTCFLPRKLKLN